MAAVVGGTTASHGQRVLVTNHALLRWRERGAKYADATAPDLEKAYAESVPLPSKGPLPYPLYRRPGTAYRRHPGGCLFVAEVLATDTVRLVTVLPPNSVQNYQLPKLKAPSEATPEETVEARQSTRQPQSCDFGVVGFIEPDPGWIDSSDGVKAIKRAGRRAAAKKRRLSNLQHIQALENKLGDGTAPP